ncbi:MAG: molecular chaperone HscC [Pyrinomonadaceae bacterium]|jgi:molecular chaperone DnaK|nr:molecular chaperone HscC [Pyrinomonadaceae bacterium]
MSAFINYGIDLGTTNSCIVRLDGDEIKIMQNADQMNVTPSVVRVLRSGSVMVGRRAYNAIAEDPDNVAAEFKRLMGQKFQHRFPASGRAMSPEELSAEVLKSLLGDARRRQGDGEGDIPAAVITVPAAFTALQCEATARAARLAGLSEHPLLQEPIAAALAYGARPDARDQRWLVFDLGGGTLDIAVVSTRDGRLSVLEHRGDNHLGGKDIDRLIVQKLFLPHLAAQYSLPDAPDAAGRLLRKLTLIAEYAKIELSTSDDAIVSLIDLGADTEGRLIESELPLGRAEVEAEIEPLVARCLQLAGDALAAARVKGADLDRVLLVGGPTQMPCVRRQIGDALGARVDYSLDPMTVVAHGAAIYGATVERATVAPRAAAAPVATDKLSVRLAFDPVSTSLEAAVAGKIDGARRDAAREVKIDTDNNFWTSGWHAVSDHYFEIPLVLQEGKNNKFLISLRDAEGRALAVEPSEFSVRHGLMISAPPLPHTISVELVQPDGTIELSPVFPRRTLLPAEKTVSYRAAKTLRPSDADTSLAIKLWEGEALGEPQANNWVGNMHIWNEHIRRPIPEGAEIQLHIKIDASRLITVEVFVPHLNANFSERVYIPQDEEPDYLELLEQVPLEFESYLRRLNLLEDQLLLGDHAGAAESFDFPEVLYEEGELPSASLTGGEENGSSTSVSDNSSQAEVDRLRREIEDLDIEIILQRSGGMSLDADAAKGLVERAREIRVRVSNLERRVGGSAQTSRATGDESVASETREYVENYGNESQKARFAALVRELERATARRDGRGVQKLNIALKHLRGQILYAQEWFWREWFEYFQRPGRKFVNADEAAKWLAQGSEATQNNNQAKLEEAVRRLWKLEPVEETAADKERSMRPGLKL